MAKQTGIEIVKVKMACFVHVQFMAKLCDKKVKDFSVSLSYNSQIIMSQEYILSLLWSFILRYFGGPGLAMLRAYPGSALKGNSW